MIISHQGRQLTFPDFLIIGAARSGTTYLYTVLSRHPQVFMPQEKEPQFLNYYGTKLKKTISLGKIVDNWQNYNLDQYSDLFRKAEEGMLLGEASVDYLSEYQQTIDNIRTLYQQAAARLKIVVVLRNPVDRAWSHHVLRFSKNNETLSFSEAIQPAVVAKRCQAGMLSTFDYLGYGLYADKVRAWKKAFPHFRIWIYEEFFADLDHYMAELAEFLGINMHNCLVVRQRVNASGVAKNKIARLFVDYLQKPDGWKKPLKKFLPQRMRQGLKRKATSKFLQRHKMNPDLRCQLFEYYRNDIKELETILNRSLDIWTPKL